MTVTTSVLVWPIPAVVLVDELMTKAKREAE